MSKYGIVQIVLVLGMVSVVASMAWIYSSHVSIPMEGDNPGPATGNLQRPDFEHDSKKTIDLWLYSQYLERGPFMEVFIYGLNNTYKLGQPVTFTALEAGYDKSNCTAPHFVIKDRDTGKVHWEYWFVHSCPAPMENGGFPILSHVPAPESLIPPIREPGTYVVRVESNYGSFAEQEITVVDSDHVFEYYLDYSKTAPFTGAKTTVRIDLNSGHFTTNLALREGRLSEEELDYIRKTIDDNGIIGSMTTGYGVGACQDCMFNRVEIGLDDYRYTLEWYDGSYDISPEHSNLIKAVNSVYDSIYSTSNKVR